MFGIFLKHCASKCILSTLLHNSCVMSFKVFKVVSRKQPTGCSQQKSLHLKAHSKSRPPFPQIIFRLFFFQRRLRHPWLASTDRPWLAVGGGGKYSQFPHVVPSSSLQQEFRVRTSRSILSLLSILFQHNSSSSLRTQTKGCCRCSFEYRS